MNSETRACHNVTSSRHRHNNHQQEISHLNLEGKAGPEKQCRQEIDRTVINKQRYRKLNVLLDKSTSHSLIAGMQVFSFMNPEERAQQKATHSQQECHCLENMNPEERAEQKSQQKCNRLANMNPEPKKKSLTYSRNAILII